METARSGGPLGRNGFANVLDQCLGIRPGEQVVLLTDGATDAEVVTRLLEAVENQHREKSHG